MSGILERMRYMKIKYIKELKFLGG